MRFKKNGTKIFEKSYRFIFLPKNDFWVIKIAVNRFFFGGGRKKVFLSFLTHNMPKNYFFFSKILSFYAYFDKKFVQIDLKLRSQ